MTREAFRRSADYVEAFDKIRGYRRGFEFVLVYESLPQGKANALRWLIEDCIKQGYLECIREGLTLEGEVTEAAYKRL